MKNLKLKITIQNPLCHSETSLAGRRISNRLESVRGSFTSPGARRYLASFRMTLHVTFYFLLVFLTFYFLLLPSKVFAHVLVSEGSIGAVLHIDPEDDPIAKEQAGFFFEFKDKENKFKPQNCDCTFSILQGGKEVYSVPLFQNNSNPSLTNASVFYTFPEKDVYKIKVVGKPYTPDTFQPFTLTYDIRVERESTSQPTAQVGASNTSNNWFSTHIIHLAGAIVIFIFVIYAIIKKIISKPKI